MLDVIGCHCIPNLNLFYKKYKLMFKNVLNLLMFYIKKSLNIISVVLSFFFFY